MNFYGIVYLIYIVPIVTMILHILLYTTVIGFNTFLGFPIWYGIAIFIHICCVAAWYLGFLNVEKFKHSVNVRDINTVQDFFFQFIFLFLVYIAFFSLALWIFLEELQSYYLTFGASFGVFAILPLTIRKPALKESDTESSGKPVSSSFVNNYEIIEEKKTKSKRKEKEKNKGN